MRKLARSIGRVAGMANGLVLAGVVKAQAQVPSGGDPVAAATGFFDWLTNTISGIVAGFATLAILIVLALALFTDNFRREYLVKVILILLAIGATPVMVEELTGSFGIFSGE